MTFNVAFAAKRWALVATDTRSFTRDGRFTDQDGPDGTRKMARLPGGWGLGGTWPALRDVALDACRAADLRHPDTVVQALELVQPAVQAMLAATGGIDCRVLLEGTDCESFATLAAGTAQLFAVSPELHGGFALRVYDYAAATLQVEACHGGFGSTPGGSPDGLVGPLMLKYGEIIEHSEPTIYQAIRLTAALFNAVWTKLGPAGSVSATVTMGVLVDGGGELLEAGWLPPTSHAALPDMPDDWIRGLCEPSPEPQPLAAAPQGAT